MVSEHILAAESVESTITGRGVRVTYQPDSKTITLYRMEGAAAVSMSKPSTIGCPIVDGTEVRDFSDDTCVVERKIIGTLGAGERISIRSISPSTGLVRTHIVEVCTAKKGVVYAKSVYQAGDADVAVTGFLGNTYELFDPGDLIWSFHGGGEGPTTFYDQLQKIDLTSPDKFTRENIQDDSAAGIPAADIYTAAGGITVGDASATRREVRTPVRQTADSAEISIQWPGITIAAGTSVEVGQSFTIVHEGDYFTGLRGYKIAMESLGVVMLKDISDRSYELRWEGWGWAFDWTMDLIIGELDWLQSIGIKQITIDDAWFDHAGDWQLNPEKFPNGEADMKRLVDAIHAHGMTALLWWRPCDGGRDDSALHREHPEYFVMREDGKTAMLAGPGKRNTTSWCNGAGYQLCPTTAGTIAATVAFINRAMNEWGFDGFKGDYVWSMAKCYNPDHHHPYPEESTERQAEIYRAAREAMVANDPECFNLLCCCGAPQDFYSLPYMTQVVTADPTSLDQTRTRVKLYKALMGDRFPVTTDHSGIWYAATIGTGAVIIEKCAFTGAEADEYARWVGIANREQLHKGRFIGDLYSYGFDPYETYVVEKNGVMYYAFYRDGRRCLPCGYPDIELKGLDPDKMYRIVDYVNDRVVATNLMGDSAVFNTRFAQYLLVKAVEITTPDTEPVDQDWGFVSVASEDERVVRADGFAEFKFAGTSVRWYGDKGAGYGRTEIYLNGELAAALNAGESEEKGVRLFEALDLPAAVHTLKLVFKTGADNIDHIAYEAAVPEPVYENVGALSDRITYGGTWQVEQDQARYMGSAKTTSEVGAWAEMTFRGTAVRWYGKRFLAPLGVGDVYLDGERIDAVYAYGEEAVGKLLFERKGLPDGEHTIRIVLNDQNIDLEYLAFGVTPKVP